MSLIFDKFPNLIKAAEFVQAIEQEFHLARAIFTTQTAANEHDPFLWVLDPPIVHI
jgi:hypothetical protein